MPRQFINEIGDGQSVDEVFQINQKQLRPNRNGNLYLQLRLSDRTGSLVAMLWNATESQFHQLDECDYARIQGAAQLYNGGMQIIAKAVHPVSRSDVDEDDFFTLNHSDVDQLCQKLGEMLRGMSNYHLRNLAECFLVDESFMTKLRAAPAGVKNHHAYKGGLLEHIVSLMHMCQAAGMHYGDLDNDLLMMGGFLHDVGKIEELSYEHDFGYSDEGQLIGHLVMGVGMLDSRIADAEALSGEPFPVELGLRLKHMIVSHHGHAEFGSPQLPMTLEAIALHFLDNLDAKLHSVSQLIREDVNKDSSWTVFNAAMGRKLYKGEAGMKRVESPLTE